MANETMARTIGQQGRDTVRTMIALVLAASLLAGGLAVVTAAAVDAQDPVKVGVMFTQSAGDKGPVDDMIAFLKKAEEDFGVETTFVEALDPSTYEAILRNMALEGHTIIAGTFGEVGEPFKALAPEFPDVRWIQIFGDDLGEGSLPNLVTVSYDYYLGTYLAGLLAGQATQTGQLGYIGGVSLPQLNADFHSYTQAAGEISADNSTTFAWAESFQDPIAGRELAAAQYAAGVDFIQTDAAATDLGIVAAAKEKDGFVIGGFEDIYNEAPANVVGIVAIFFGQSLYDQIGNALSDDYTAGHINSGLHDGVVDLLISDRFLAEGPADMVAAVEAAIPAVDAARAGILDGSVEVVFNTDAP